MHTDSLGKSGAGEGTRWYYGQDGQAVGPLPLLSIQTLAKAGQLPADVLVFREGGDQWQPLAVVSLGLPSEALIDSGTKGQPTEAVSKSDAPKTALWAKCGVVLIVILFAVLMFDELSAPERSRQRRQTELGTGLEGRIQFFAEETFQRRRDGQAKVLSVKKESDSRWGQKGVIISITYRGHEAATAGFLLNEVIEFLKKEDGNQFSEVTGYEFHPVGTFIDMYGKQTEGPIATFGITRAVLRKINWNNISRDDFAYLLSVEKDAFLWWHPTFLKGTSQ